MRKAARRYRTLLTAPGVGPLYASSLIGRLPVGMGMLLFVLVVHAGTGSYTIAGLAAAANAAATAFCGPPLGRLSDRGHAALILVLTGLAQGITLVGLVVALKAHLDSGLIIGIGALAGVVNPPVAAVTRTVLPRLAPDERSRQTAFALDALLVEMTFVVGPALVGVVSAIWDGYTATMVAAVLNVVGSFGLAATRSVRQRYPLPPPDQHRAPATRWQRLIGPLASGGLRIVLVVSVLEAAAFGVLEVAIPAYTNARGLPQAGGLLFAVWSGGSIVGGLWFGGQDFHWPLGRQYALLMALNVVGFGSVLLAGGPVTLGALLFFAGLFISPTTAVEAALVTELAPPENTTEAFTWSGTAIYLGFALGSGLAAVALSGSLGSTSALTTATLLAIGLSAAGMLTTIVGRRSLRTAPRLIVAPA
jgi:MFS family permease